MQYNCIVFTARYTCAPTDTDLSDFIGILRIIISLVGIHIVTLYARITVGIGISHGSASRAKKRKFRPIC